MLTDQKELQTDILNLLSEMAKVLTVAILSTPTGSVRNHLTDLNIKRLDITRKLQELQ